MTIQKQPPGLWFAFCDTCGDKRELDTDPDDSIMDAVAEVKELGWRVNQPDRRHREITWTHDCATCRA